MSRKYHCDGCNRVIDWDEGSKKAFGDPPPITVRGRGLVLDFCSIRCMGSYAHKHAEKERQGGS